MTVTEVLEKDAAQIKPTASEARAHHYVPVFYQRRFTNAEELLWVYDRRQKTCKLLNPKSVCVEKEFYTVKSKDGPWERRIETACFSLVDGMGSWAIRELLAGSRTRETIRGVSYFMSVQMHRTPSFKRHISALHVAGAEEMMRLMAVNVERMQSVMDRYSRETGEVTDISAESMVEAVRGEHIKAVATEVPFLSNIFGMAEGTSRIIEQIEWQILIAPEHSSFITCDDPMTVVPPEGVRRVGFGVPGTITYFPLGRQYCLRLDGLGHSLSYRRVSKETVQMINCNITANSERFVMGPEKAQLTSAINRSGSAAQDYTPHFTVQVVNPDENGSLIEVSHRPARYFYLKGTAP